MQHFYKIFAGVLLAASLTASVFGVKVRLYPGHTKNEEMNTILSDSEIAMLKKFRFHLKNESMWLLLGELVYQNDSKGLEFLIAVCKDKMSQDDVTGALYSASQCGHFRIVVLLTQNFKSEIASSGTAIVSAKMAYQKGHGDIMIYLVKEFNITSAA